MYEPNSLLGADRRFALLWFRCEADQLSIIHTNTNNVVIKSQKSTDEALIILVERDFPEIFSALYMYRYSIDILIPPFLKTNC